MYSINILLIQENEYIKSFMKCWVKNFSSLSACGIKNSLCSLCKIILVLDNYNLNVGNYIFLSSYDIIF